MSIRNNSNRLVNPMAREAMDNFKLEVAQSLDISNDYQSGYWGNMTSRECGSVGGEMVKQMVEDYENKIANNNPTTNYTQSTQTEQNNYNLKNKVGSFKPQQ